MYIYIYTHTYVYIGIYILYIGIYIYIDGLDLRFPIKSHYKNHRKNPIFHPHLDHQLTTTGGLAECHRNGAGASEGQRATWPFLFWKSWIFSH